ncbi:MAG: hypothetical protein PUA56_02490 [Bacillales bacterium]|nr:hypothetical protein [Bacillales bacterium]
MKGKRIIILAISLLLCGCKGVIDSSINSSTSTSSDSNVINTSENSTDLTENNTTSNTTSNSSSSEVNKLFCYTIYVNGTTSSSVNYSSKLDTILKNDGAVTSYTGSSNINGSDSNYIRIGSSKNSGTLVINTQSIKVQSVEIEGDVWSNDGISNTRVALSSGLQEDYKWVEDTDYSHIYTFNDTNDCSSISISTLNASKERLLVNRIKIYAYGGEGNNSNNSSTENKSILKCVSDFQLTNGNTVSSKEEYNGYYKPVLNPTFNFQNYRTLNNDPAQLSEGKVKMLVIPISFVDYPASKLGSEDVSQKRIYDCFFGKTADTGWESVKTYYEKASYGKMTMEGVVLPWYNSTYSTKTFASLSGKGTYAEYYDPTWTLLEKAIDYAKSLNVDLKEYDNNKDGLIDGVWLVYSCPTEYNGNADIFWAYTYANYDSYDKASTANPVPYAYSWASYSFMDEGQYGKVDAHTFIHETGHMIGLDDYYSYGDENGDVKEGPCGGVDMMDFNIGDHNAYSKFLLNWTSPYVVDGTSNNVSITLKPFESSGDFILLRDSSWNNSSLDEYFLIEYYTPTGLNEKDLTPYTYGLSTYSEKGVKIWHVDSRVLEFSDDENDGYNYVDSINHPEELYYQIGSSNSPYYSMDENGYDSSNKLITLIEHSHD